ncbi:hypothetical protein COLO4_27947 [Corchorus olitorius]|uniref:Uncharacterized protein n=1 Tax=Corchorus olitorius TaxID=93759 RepID=A0A1R3HNG8_9ROSI|nr:hypothetical protein COLO4_27947 [Corchorus olitorius]
MDLRYAIPPILNMILFLFLSSWNSRNYLVLISSISVVQQFSVLKVAAIIILAVILLLLFLFTSVEIPLILTPIRLRLHVGHFSIALTASFLASLFLPPSLFWAVYLLIVCLTPWHHALFQLLKQLFRWLSGAVKSFPVYLIIIAAAHRDEESRNAGPTDPSPIEVDVELGYDDLDYD